VISKQSCQYKFVGVLAAWLNARPIVTRSDQASDVRECNFELLTSLMAYELPEWTDLVNMLASQVGPCSMNRAYSNVFLWPQTLDKHSPDRFQT
jgi:hypothetical protein